MNGRLRNARVDFSLHARLHCKSAEVAQLVEQPIRNLKTAASKLFAINAKSLIANKNLAASFHPVSSDFSPSSQERVK